MIFNNGRINNGDTMDTTEKIKEIDWTNINNVLDEIADYYLKKFEIDNKLNEKLIKEFTDATLKELNGIRIEDYIKTNNCSFELISKYDKLLRIKNNFFNTEYSDKNEKVPIESYLTKMKEAIKQRDKFIQASIDPNQSMEDVEKDYSLITELLGTDDIVIKFKENN